MFYYEKKRKDATQSYAKAPTPLRKIRKATRHYKNTTKTSITRRLQTDIGRSVGVIFSSHQTVVVKLVYIQYSKVIYRIGYSKHLFVWHTGCHLHFTNKATVTAGQICVHWTRYVSRHNKTVRNSLGGQYWEFLLLWLDSFLLLTQRTRTGQY